jgi:hypothetical protein
MKSGLPFLFGLLVVAVLGGGFMQLSVMHYINEPPPAVTAQGTSFTTTSLPPVERLRSPHALLVLDVSGSMKTSDHDHKQSAAVSRFYEVYLGLSRETLANSESAKVAVVLFSTVAQVIDWNGQGQAWLDVTPENAKAFSQMVENYLGTGANEPRKGQDTDYIAALDEVGRLADGLASPPLVLFMTDGIFEPNPLFSTHVAVEQKMKLAPSVYGSKQREIEEVAGGGKRFLSIQRKEPVFDPRSLQAGGVKPTPALNIELSALVPESVQKLAQRTFELSRREPTACLFWAPLYLAESPGVNLAAAVAGALAPQTECRTWGEKTHFISVRDPRELPGDFVGILSSWFRLLELPIQSGSTGVMAPAEVQAFAVYIETGDTCKEFDLAQGNSVIGLSGQNGQWAGVSKKGGEWTFRGDCGSVRGGNLYYRLRHEWALRLPSTWYKGENEEDLRLEVLLMSLDTEKPVAAASVYGNLPESLPGILKPLSGGTPATVTLHRYQNASGDVAYSAQVPTKGFPSGRAEVQVSLSALQDSAIPISRETLGETLEIRPAVRVRVRTSDGRSATLGARGLPREGHALERLWERIRGK